MNVKFTATVFVGVLLAGAAVLLYYRLTRTDFRRAFIAVGAAVLVAVLVVGFDPYVTNTVMHKHPFWPVMGPDAVAVATADIIPADFASGNRFGMLFRSIFYVSSDPIAPARSTPKLPFTIQPIEYKTFTTPDVRVGQMGPLFGGAVLLAIVLTIAVLFVGGWRDWLVLLTLGVVAITLFTVAINPDSWWMRYNPQLWLAVVFLVSLAFTRRGAPLVKALAVATCVLLLANVAFVATLNWGSQVSSTQTVAEEITRLRALPQPIGVHFELKMSNRERFREAGITYTVLKEAPKGGTTLFNSDTTVAGL
jgi:hypothetical protein